MNSMFSLITELLHANVCVVVPGLGGFVVNRKSAVVDVHSGLFCPPSVQVVFNSKLNHNDGLLCQAWANRYGCTMAEAAEQIDGVVARFSAELRGKGTVVVPGFGVFSADADGYSFVSAVEQQGFAESFGLQNFVAPRLNETQKDNSNTARLAKKVGVGVAAAALVTLLLSPFGSSVSSNFASFVPSLKTTERLVVNAHAHEVLEMADKVQAENKQVVKEAVEKASVVAPRFYVVLKRFASANEADAFVGNWQAKLSDSLAVVPVSEQCFAVACANTENAELALKMMDNVRKNSSFKETFILYK